MNQKRHFNSIISILATMILTTVTLAEDKERRPIWDNGSSPIFHTNQDGPMGAQTPNTPIDSFVDNKAPKQVDKPTLINLVAQLSFNAPPERRPKSWAPIIPPTAGMGVAASPANMPLGMNPVPAPGALVLLGMAGLTGRRRRGPDIQN
ncbi:MAG: hypothetical protein QGI75_07950 [Phycisphaerales bacterium]|jgi:MYXO-CTERM domain-containing protein|nr:hypothetical protein [Phycisphaerales bacterium]MDP6891339.1 hypothetical protein [Phycisphaerales bacterium]